MISQKMGKWTCVWSSDAVAVLKKESIKSRTKGTEVFDNHLWYLVKTFKKGDKTPSRACVVDMCFGFLGVWSWLSFLSLKRGTQSVPNFTSFLVMHGISMASLATSLQNEHSCWSKPYANYKERRSFLIAAAALKKLGKWTWRNRKMEQPLSKLGPHCCTGFFSSQ